MIWQFNLWWPLNFVSLIYDLAFQIYQMPVASIYQKVIIQTAQDYANWKDCKLDVWILVKNCINIVEPP